MWWYLRVFLDVHFRIVCRLTNLVFDLVLILCAYCYVFWVAFASTLFVVYFRVVLLQVFGFWVFGACRLWWECLLIVYLLR